MSVNGKTILLSGALLFGAFQGTAQTVVRDTSGTRAISGHLTGETYQVDNAILSSFGDEGFDPLVKEVDEPSDIMPDSTTHSVQKTTKIRVDGHSEVRRFNTRMISSTDNHLATDEVKAEQLIYISKENDLVLVIERPSAKERNGDICISGYSAKDSVEFVRVKVPRPFRLGDDEGKLFYRYDRVTDHVDNTIEDQGVDGLQGLVLDFAKVAQDALDAEQWQRMINRLAEPKP